MRKANDPKPSTLTQERLKQLLSYDPETGVFIRLESYHAHLRGRQVGSPATDGHLRIYVDGQTYYSHRLAFLYMTGAWPAPVVDHVNGDKADNRWSNLRESTTSLNLQNLRKPTLRSKTGLLGVALVGNPNLPYRASLEVQGGRTFVQSFATAEEASAAYLKAKRELHPGCTI